MEEESNEKPFFDRPFEEVEGGYFDERGFYTTPDGSFWDSHYNYFNSLGYDIHGGRYDKYGVYIPGNNYDENTGIYEDEKELYNKQEEEDAEEKEEIKKTEINLIEMLKKEHIRDQEIINKYYDLFEDDNEDEEEDDDGDENNRNIFSLDENNNENIQDNFNTDMNNNSILNQEIEDAYNEAINIANNYRLDI